MITPWDNIADKFDTYKGKGQMYYGAADNIETVWPVFLDFIKKHFPMLLGLKALDFGCGTGMFCKKLHDLGFKATGIDISKEMIKIAKNNLKPEEANLYVGDSKFAKTITMKEGAFGLITSIMVFQFMEEYEFGDLADALGYKGYLIFAVHNPMYLKNRVANKEYKIGGTQTSVPIYPRTAESYTKIFEDYGLTKILEYYPSESDEFLKKYNMQKSPEPKYVILAFQKK